MKRLWVAILTGFLIGVTGAVLADLYLKERVPVFCDFAGLQYSLNPGIAYGIQLPVALQSVLILAALCLVTFLAFKKGHSTIALWGYGILVGGGLANAFDRIRDGYVTDFFQVGTFPIFNTADSCITIGIFLLLVDAFLIAKRTSN